MALGYSLAAYGGLGNHGWLAAIACRQIS